MADKIAAMEAEERRKGEKVKMFAKVTIAHILNCVIFHFFIFFIIVILIHHHHHTIYQHGHLCQVKAWLGNLEERGKEEKVNPLKIIVILVMPAAW